MEIISYLDDSGTLKKGAPSIPKDVLLKAYEIMLQTRMVDDRMVTLQRQGTISFAMLSLGEEACAVGSAAALELADWLYPQYREAGIIFWRGFTIREYVDHMFCNCNDIILGRQMPNHFGSRKLNVVTVSSPIGTKIPHAAGCAYAMKVQKEKSVAVCYFGEGASSEGDFHAGINFAAVRKAPAIFFCRNNGYAISTPASAQFASDGIVPKAIGYGIEGVRVDGNDFFAVYDVVQKARQHCLDVGPVLIEAMTYRMGAHSTSDDPSKYRTEEEVEKWRIKDPIARLGKYLEKKKLWSKAKDEELKKKIAHEIDQAIENSKGACSPPIHSLFEHVYFELTPTLEREQDSVVHRSESCQK
ncbi:MAG: thiamine pyrophosphate-dependent enzyme [Parachlamydiales bacterium]